MPVVTSPPQHLSSTPTTSSKKVISSKSKNSDTSSSLNTPPTSSYSHPSDISKKHHPKTKSQQPYPKPNSPSKSIKPHQKKQMFSKIDVAKVRVGLPRSPGWGPVSGNASRLRGGGSFCGSKVSRAALFTPRSPAAPPALMDISTTLPDNQLKANDKSHDVRKANPQESKRHAPKGTTRRANGCEWSKPRDIGDNHTRNTHTANKLTRNNYLT